MSDSTGSPKQQPYHSNWPVPYGMTAEMWSDCGPDASACRAAHWFLAYLSEHDGQSDRVLGTAAELFGAEPEEIKAQIAAAAKLKRGDEEY
jgi:hypothetical protein